MRIYIFNIYEEGEITISQVYCNNYFAALDSLILSSGCNEDNIEFMGYEPTCEPLDWEINHSEITF